MKNGSGAGHRQASGHRHSRAQPLASHSTLDPVPATPHQTLAPTGISCLRAVPRCPRYRSRPGWQEHIAGATSSPGRWPCTACARSQALQKCWPPARSRSHVDEPDRVAAAVTDVSCGESRDCRPTFAVQCEQRRLAFSSGSGAMGSQVESELALFQDVTASIERLRQLGADESSP